MIFFKTLQQLLLPGTFTFILIIIGLLLLLKKRKKRVGKIFIAMGLLLYYLFSTTIVSNFLIAPLEEGYSYLRIQDMDMADKAVLLLGGREADILRGSEVLRIYHLKKGWVKVIISGTDPLLPTSQEAVAVKQFFVSRGMDEDDIVIEGDSRNTWENIRNVKEIVGEKPFFLVTSAYHMERSIREFQRVEANPIPAPTDFKIKTDKYGVLDFFPNAQNLRKSDLAFHEYMAILWYTVRNI